MNRDRLRPEVEDWVREELITPEQAAAILARYEGRDDVGRSRSRVVIALSLMGVVLVGLGLVVYLGNYWAEMTRWSRTAVVLAIPATAFAGGWWLRTERQYPQVGHGLIFLGAAFSGVSLVALIDIYGIDIGPEWFLLGWAVVALPTGHAIRSRPTSQLGLGVVAGVLLALDAPGDPTLLVGLYGVTLYGIGLYRRTRGDASLAWTYQSAGVAGGLLALLILVVRVSHFGRPGIEPSTVLAATALGGALAAGFGAWLVARTVVDRTSGSWPGVTAAALAIVGFVATTVPVPYGFGAFLAVHATMVATLTATVAAGYREETPAVVNVAVLVFLAQLVVFLTAIANEILSGAFALVVTGLTLLATGLALERGRRKLLRNMAESG